MAKTQKVIFIKKIKYACLSLTYYNLFNIFGGIDKINFNI